jgi:signal transduction histidine kinase
MLWVSGDLHNHKFISEFSGLFASSTRIIISILASIGTHTFYLEKKQKEIIYNQKQALEKSNTELNKFIGMAAHDIRNPVANIKMIADILVEDQTLSTETKAWMEVIQVSASNSLLILNNTLNISQIQSGTVVLNFSNEDYISFIKNNLLMNNHLATTKKQSILFQSEIETIMVTFDLSRMLQVMNNLLNNAIKYSPEYSTIVVSVLYDEKLKGNIGTYVKDEGLGIDEAFHDSIYKAFSTTPNQPTNNETKTGLGLAIVKKIVEMHQGCVGFHSKKGTGSEFYFSIPISQNSHT